MTPDTHPPGTVIYARFPSDGDGCNASQFFPAIVLAWRGGSQIPMEVCITNDNSFSEYHSTWIHPQLLELLPEIIP